MCVRHDEGVEDVAVVPEPQEGFFGRFENTAREGFRVTEDNAAVLVPPSVGVPEIDVPKNFFQRRIKGLRGVSFVVVCKPVLEEVFERRVGHKLLDFAVDIFVDIG